MERAAFDELVRRHHPRVLRIARAILGDATAAEDAAQEVWLGVLRAPPRTLGATWLERAAVSRALDQKRRRRASQGEDEPVARGEGPFGEASANELRRRLETELENLPRQQALVFRLRHFGGFPLGEVAELLQRSLPTTKTHLARAVLGLRRRLGSWQPHGHSSPGEGARHHGS